MDTNIKFINIGERTNVTGSSLFKKLIMNDNFLEAVAVAKSQIEKHIIYCCISMPPFRLVSLSTTLCLAQPLANWDCICKGNVPTSTCGASSHVAGCRGSVQRFYGSTLCRDT